MTPDLAIALLLVVGFAFMVLEAFTPLFGLLGAAGALSFFAALAMLRGRESIYGIPVDMDVLLVMGICGLIVLAVSLYWTFRLRKVKPMTGSEFLIGLRAKVVEWNGTAGRVAIEGEVWNASGPADLASGDSVIITHVHQLTLTVVQAEEI